MFEISTEVLPEDMSILITQETKNSDFLRVLFQDAERKTEVILRNLSSEERGQFQTAKQTELDHWMQHSVYSIAS